MAANYVSRTAELTPAFAEFLDHLLVERRNIIGFAACDQAIIHDDFFIHPTRSSVTHIGLNRRPRSYLSSANEIRANQHLRPVTNCGHRFAFAEEMARKFERSASGFNKPPGIMSASNSSGRASATARSTSNLSL